MSVGTDGEADVPAEAEEPGGGSGDRAGGAGAGEYREQRQRAPRPRHQLQQRRDNATTQGPQEVSTPVHRLSSGEFYTSRGQLYFPEI